MVSVLIVVPARELTDLGTEPYLENLTLILWPKSAVILGISVRASGIKSLIFGEGYGLGLGFGLG